MRSNNFTIRFSDEELKTFKAEAAACGLSVGTFIKMTLQAALKSNQFDERLYDSQQRDRQVWKRELIALLTIKNLLLDIAAKQGVCVTREQEAEYEAAIDELFANAHARVA